MKSILKSNLISISFAILALVFIAADAQAYDPDARNDFMCVAIFKVAFEQEAVGIARDEKLQYYSDRISIFKWKLIPTKDTYERTVFRNRVSGYMDNLDSADVLLYMDRCKIRALELYTEFLNNHDWRKKS